MWGEGGECVMWGEGGRRKGVVRENLFSYGECCRAAILASAVHSQPLMLSGGRWSSHSSRKYSSEIVITGYIAHTCTRTHTHAHTYARTHLHTHMPAHTTHTHTTHTHHAHTTHTHTPHTHTHTHTHTHCMHSISSVQTCGRSHSDVEPSWRCV